AVQGCVAIGQYVGIRSFWLIPDLQLSRAARGDQALLLAAVEDLQSIGRVRGTHMFVHKFAATHGAMVAYLLVAVGGSRQLCTSFRGRAVLLALVILAFVGSVLTFSRSAFVGSAF